MPSIRRPRSDLNIEEDVTEESIGISPDLPSSPIIEDTFDVISATDVATLCGSSTREVLNEQTYTTDTASVILKGFGRFTEGSTGKSSSDDKTMADTTWASEDERQVFEEQLNQLQERLMIVMIENQALQSELIASRDKTELERVKAELAYERHRCQVLQRGLGGPNNKIQQKTQRSHSDLQSRVKRRRNQRQLSRTDSSDSLEELGYPQPDGSEKKFAPVPVQTPRFYQALLDRLMHRVALFMEDFSDEPEEQTEAQPEVPLAVKTLKENIKRFGEGAKPVINTAKGIGELVAWQSPRYTLLVFLVYMYSAWQGWTLPAVLFCFTFRLFINYLNHRGWDLNFNFFDTVEEKVAEDKDLGVSDKFNLVMNVARKVQNILGDAADGLEKMKSVLTWRHPTASSKLFFALLVASISSCVMPYEELFYPVALIMGVKLFLVDYIYTRYPRVKRKYDTGYRIWQELPTDLQYEKSFVKSEIHKYITPAGSNQTGSQTDKGEHQNVSTDDRAFCELFSLPESECPRTGWQGGRRCSLINREKSLAAAFKSGKLYLTHSFLCFERSKVPSPKNIVIPLADIARLEKAKPYSWLPGGGMAIEISVVGQEKTLVFGGLKNRDELYDSICEGGLQKLTEITKDDASLPWMESRKSVKKKTDFVPKQYKPFSLANTYTDSD